MSASWTPVELLVTEPSMELPEKFTGKPVVYELTYKDGGEVKPMVPPDAKEMLIYSFITIEGSPRQTENLCGYYKIGLKKEGISGFEFGCCQYLNFVSSQKKGDLTMNSVNAWLPRSPDNKLYIELVGPFSNGQGPGLSRVRQPNGNNLHSNIFVIGHR